MADTNELSPSVRKQLLGRSHRLDPVVVVGHAGLSEAVIEQIKHVLKTNDLIKVRIQAEDREAVQAVAREIAVKTDAALVTKIGKIAVLYKAKPPDAV